MADTVRIQVLLAPDVAERFENYCVEYGHKKSTLIAHLVREFLDREAYPSQGSLFASASFQKKKRA